MINQNVGGKREGRGKKDARFLLAGNCMDGRARNREEHSEGAGYGRGMCAVLDMTSCLEGRWKYLMRDDY